MNIVYVALALIYLIGVALLIHSWKKQHRWFNPEQHGGSHPPT